jgi:histidinol-phosphate aminotransferase
MSPKARAAAEQALSQSHRYPNQYELTQKLAAKLNVNPAQLVLGSGSNDVLDLVARTYLRQGTEAVSSQYAFAMYGIAVQSVGATSVVVPAKDYGHDLQAMAAAVTPRTKVIWIANPNNPTGTFVPYPQIKLLLEQISPGVIVVLDEAYYEYLDPSDQAEATKWLAKHPNLVITRTFSKAYGLAGLRIGYAVASQQVAELLNRVRLPFNVTIPAMAAACGALDDQAFVARSVAANAKGRKQLLDGLQKLGLECLPAYGNFVTVKTKGAVGVNQKLLAHGVIVRPLVGYDMADWLRITIGVCTENQRLLSTLAGALDGQVPLAAARP